MSREPKGPGPDGGKMKSIRRLRSAFRHSTWFVAIGAILVVAHGVFAAATLEHESVDSRSGFSALPPSAQAGISAAIGQDEPVYHAAARPHGASMQNPAQGF